MDTDLEALVEELPLGEAHPPLVGLSVTMGVEDIKETNISLLTDLLEVSAKGVLIAAVSGLGAETTKGKGAVARDSKVLDGVRVEDLVSLTLGLVSALHKASVDVEGDVDEQTIGIATHIECAEHDVGLEVVECLVNDILLVRGGVRSRALELGCVTDGQEGDVADVPPVAIRDGLSTLRLFVKASMISSRRHFYTAVSSDRIITFC